MATASCSPAQKAGVAADAEAVTVERLAVVTPAAAERHRVSRLQVRRLPQVVPVLVVMAVAAGAPVAMDPASVTAATAPDDGPVARAVSGKVAVGRHNRARPVDVPEVIFTQVSARVFL